MCECELNPVVRFAFIQIALAVHLSLTFRLIVSDRSPKVFVKMIPLDLGRPLIAVNTLRQSSDLMSASRQSNSDNNLSTCVFPDVLTGEMFEANVPLGSSCDNLELDQLTDDLSSISSN